MNFVDIFSGCGGFSEGFYDAGFTPIGHLDWDHWSCETVKKRKIDRGYSVSSLNTVVEGDITDSKVISRLLDVVRGKTVDVLVGGPPCQAFSSVGRAQDPNSMRNDPRNFLYRSYVEVLEAVMPKVFVFENVTGVLSAMPNGVRIFPEIVADLEQRFDVYSCEKKIVLNSVHYGVPQIRKRVILLGVQKGLGLSPKAIHANITKTHAAPNEEDADRIRCLTVKDAISDLPKLLPGEGEEVLEWSGKTTNAYALAMRTNANGKLFNHVARNHNAADQERYALLSANEWQLRDLVEVRPDLVHHDPRHFGNRYTVQKWNSPGRTVVAHLYKDGNLFIHPDATQHRTLTVREAARLQSFPDDFVFMGSRTNQYKQVGNAVPPRMAVAIAGSIRQALS